MAYDENDRSDSKEDHDLLIRIDQNVQNFIEAFHAHIIKDEDTFKKLDEQASRLQRGYWIAIGIIIAVDFFIKFIK